MERYQVISHDYSNSGGGCMLLTTKVYDLVDNAVRYVYTNEEGCTLVTVDYVFSEIDYCDRMSLAYYNFDERQAHFTLDQVADIADLNKLFEECALEHIKACARYNRAPVVVDVSLLPLALIELMPDGYEAWLLDHGEGVLTDGTTIVVDDRFVEETCSKPQFIKDLEELKDYMNDSFTDIADSDAAAEEFYDLKITLSFGNKIVVLDNIAAAFDALQEAIDNIISEY